MLPSHALFKTGPVDHGDWLHKPGLRLILRRRVSLIRALLGTSKFGDLLEVGYGSGVLMPVWAEYSQRLTGLDVHPHAERVQRVLADHGTTATCVSASAEAMPFPDASFDAVIAVSVLEFIPDLEAACREMTRVLRPGGKLFLVMPGKSWLTDLGLRVLTGESALKDYGSGRERVLGTLAKHFEIAAERHFPPLVGRTARLYTAQALRPRSPASNEPKASATVT